MEKKRGSFHLLTILTDGAEKTGNLPARESRSIREVEGHPRDVDSDHFIRLPANISRPVRQEIAGEGFRRRFGTFRTFRQRLGKKDRLSPTLSFIILLILLSAEMESG